MEKALTNKGFKRSSIASIFSVMDNCQIQGANLEGQEPRATLRSKAQPHRTSCCSSNQGIHQGKEWNFLLNNCSLKDLGARFYWGLECYHVDGLQRIPVYLPLSIKAQPSHPPSLKQIKAIPREWWESLEWDHPNAKDVLCPMLEFEDSTLSESEQSEWEDYTLWESEPPEWEDYPED
ncbi:hypothetical protein SLEP1_g41173 [Rubroshorea leprosula]|uniref:Uncharacterized protein n=1 Tax=Rubroshorea leprosula TaxID=152421 RepID=A0AAV5L5N6_9ROSI|nr:hypothetical protein SLEP1_g41173 [Rubroshorea leprosula]